MVLLTALLPSTARPDCAQLLEAHVAWKAAAQPGYAGWEVVVVLGGGGGCWEGGKAFETGNGSLCLCLLS